MIRFGWFLPVFVLTLVSAPASAAKIPLTVAVDGLAEAASFRGDSATVVIEAQVDSLPAGSLGPLLVSIRVRDEDGHTLINKERVDPVPPDTTKVRRITWSFGSGPGKVHVQVRVKALDFEGSGDGECTLDVPRFSKEAFRVSTTSVQILKPYGRVPLQSHKLLAGPDRVRILLMLHGVWNQNPPHGLLDSLRVRFMLRRQSRVVKDSTFVNPGNVAVVLEENPARWGSGPYSFEISLTSPLGTVRRMGEFRVEAGGADLLRDPVLVRTVLGYIATGEERLAIETASQDSLPAMWERFWKRRDPSPGTAMNEAMNRFVERVTQATNRFGGVVPGWKSDRGRILIQHGAPDRTERVFDPTTRTDTEIWYYDQRNQNYVFQDPEGFGNYKLTGGQ